MRCKYGALLRKNDWGGGESMASVCEQPLLVGDVIKNSEHTDNYLTMAFFFCFLSQYLSTIKNITIQLTYKTHN
jgi:hypothetical protein